MQKQKFKKSLEIYKKDLQKLIYLHIHNKIYLDNQQLNKVLKLRGGKQRVR